MRHAVVLVLLFSSLAVRGQLGGENAFDFLSLPVSARANAQGGTYVVLHDDDPGLSMANPSLLTHDGLDRELHVTYSPFFAGTHFAGVNYVHSFRPATFQFGARYYTIGNEERTDPFGASMGLFTANEVALSAGGAYRYDRFHFGVNTHLVFGQMDDFTSLGMAFDISAMYVDTARLFSAALVVRNAGFMLKTYTPGDQELLPVDVQVGFTKRFRHLPFRVNVTAHNLYRWDIRPDDPDDQGGGDDLFDDGAADGPGAAGRFFDNLAAHLIVGGELTIRKAFWIGVAYNHLRRRELALSTRGGFSGFSLGMGLDLRRWSVQYGFGKYHLQGGGHQFSFRLDLGAPRRAGSAPE